jgi:hypothetical protein
VHTQTRFTSINFAKNQLFLSLIGLSPLATSHPRLLLQTSVRPSKRIYALFSLLMARSLSFGSNEKNRSHGILLAFALPPHHCLSKLFSFTRWPIMQKVHRHFFMKLRLLVSVLVHIFSLPYNRVLFTFPSQYLYTIDLETIFRLRRWFSQFSNTKAFYLHALFATENTGLSPSLVEYSNSF